MTIRRPNPHKLIVGPDDVVDLGGAVADASIVVGAEATNVRAVTIQLKDGQGRDLAMRASVDIALFADANGDAFVATGGSTGIAIGTDGALLPIVAKKLFKAVSEEDGDIDLTWTDTGTEAAYPRCGGLCLLLPFAVHAKWPHDARSTSRRWFANPAFTR
ncbi:hypothetical protein [Sinorhizobium sp. RAC02]|uniref:hypothetical protein n=1 Tax=Sinorhizobium sp. RAC02 TaxID=1842534 RepID=UPI00083D969F|nr:hypothetical protein [Sinorhizobium sp. RAC02]AOF94195.1 hypothetical protein BSY16_4067 [Sinorhizobium sp. RAC02]